MPFDGSDTRFLGTCYVRKKNARIELLGQKIKEYKGIMDKIPYGSLKKKNKLILEKLLKDGFSQEEIEAYLEAFFKENSFQELTIEHVKAETARIIYPQHTINYRNKIFPRDQKSKKSPQRSIEQEEKLGINITINGITFTPSDKTFFTKNFIEEFKRKPYNNHELIKYVEKNSHLIENLNKGKIGVLEKT